MNSQAHTILLALLVLIAGPLVFSFAFRSNTSVPANHYHRPKQASTTTFTALSAAPIGPVARAKKMMDPQEYNRVVEEKMKKEKLTREQVEEQYNQFLENPGFYYALDKKEEYYKSLGYKDIFEGMIGEAEKAGNGEEVRERIETFKRNSQIKAYSTITFFIAAFLYVRSIYIADPENFLPGI